MEISKNRVDFLDRKLAAKCNVRFNLQLLRKKSTITVILYINNAPNQLFVSSFSLYELNYKSRIYHKPI